MTMDVLLPVLTILLLSNLVQATFSFGGALVALPLLTLYLDVRFSTALLTLMSLSISMVVVFKSWKTIDWKSSRKLIISSLVGVPIGVYLLVFLDETVIKGVLSVTIISFAFLNLISVQAIKHFNTNYAYGFGFAAGLFGGAYSMSGPPVVLYASLSGWEPAKFRSTIQSYALITNAFATASHAAAGNITEQVVSLYLYSIPIVIFCIWLGGYIHTAIPAENYKKFVNYLLLALGINLIYSLV